jgi:two-component system sensor histidine kinase/response regulator
MSNIMVASTSHDMRTPLNTILNMHSMIEKELTDVKLLKLLRVSKTATNILISLVNDTLDFYQIKSGKFQLKPSAFKLRDLLENCF